MKLRVFKRSVDHIFGNAILQLTATILIIVLVGFASYGQLVNKRKLVIDSCLNWPTITNAKICNNGTHLWYAVESNHTEPKVVLVNITRDEQVEIVGATEAIFSSDNKWLTCSNNKAELKIVSLEDFRIETIVGIKKFDVVGVKDQKIVYLERDLQRTVVRNYAGTSQQVFNHSTDYFPSEANSKLAISVYDKSNSVYILRLFDLLTQGEEDIFQGGAVSRFIYNDASKSCAFEVTIDNSTSSDLYVKESDENSPHRVLSSSMMSEIPLERKINSFIFNRSGQILLIDIISNNKSILPASGASESEVLIWSHTDMVLPLANRGASPEEFHTLMKYDLHRHDLSKISSKERVSLNQNSLERYGLLVKAAGPQAHYKKDQRPILKVLDLVSATIVDIDTKSVRSITLPTISPNEKFVIWFDDEKSEWLCYEIKTKKVFNLSIKVQENLYDEEAKKINRSGPWGIAGWWLEENSVLLYDQFDIWKVPLDSITKGINITKSIGRKSKIVFTIVNGSGNSTYQTGTSLILSSYSRLNKNGCYWTARLANKIQDNNKHFQSFSIATRTPIGNYGFASGDVVKAKNAEIFLVTSETARSSRNIFVSRNLNSYSEVSNLHPEKSFFWIKADLYSWLLPDGRQCQGILYVPENLNSAKRYPVILNYYEKRSDELHKFHKPEYSKGNLNIPAFVAEGYLIFVPDIYSDPGNNGLGTFNSIESARALLCSLPFVDTNKIGLQGHSYGGWQTSYMITHSKKFAAACEAAGVSNQISAYGQLGKGRDVPRDAFYELRSQGSPYGVGITPWTHPQLYLRNSPITNIGEIETPLLMMHNPNDAAVPFEQAIELFVGMRRAGKRVWLLQYPSEGHQLTSDKAGKDYHQRLIEFFGFYLKGQPLPSWMNNN